MTDGISAMGLIFSDRKTRERAMEEQKAYEIKRDCDTCGRPETGQVCTLPIRMTNECLKSDERRYWISRQPVNDQGHSRSCRCDACVDYWNRQQVEPDRLDLDDQMRAARIIEREQSDHDVESHDMVNHPPHYTSHPSGVEVIQITEHENFCIGSAIKYLLRAGKKGPKIEDLQKAGWYINREIRRLENEH